MTRSPSSPDPASGSWHPNVPGAPPDQGFPADVALALDRSAQLLNAGRTLVGGDPPRALRLSDAGAVVLTQLCVSGAGASVAARGLARTLTDAGLAHPRPKLNPGSAAREVTVVIPVRDRLDSLDRCLAATLARTPATENRRADGPKVVVVDDGSKDAAAVSAICERHAASVVRLPNSGGPAAARNAALTQVDTPLVAFLDSDCVPEPGWISALAGHFVDPLVAAVAPRVQGYAPPDAGPVGRFAAAHSPLDLDARPARVVPGGRVSYVPTAALLVRSAALGDGFDPWLRYGEDVDLVWRLHDAGWRIRYESAVTVRHAESNRLRVLAARRFHYGTSAAPLALRHPGRLSPLVLHPSYAAVAGFALAGRLWISAGVVGLQSGAAIRRLRPVGVPAREAIVWQLRGVARTALVAGRFAATVTPVLLIVAGVLRRSRLAAGVLAAAPPLTDWVRRRPPLDPLRWTALSLADDAAYGAGVWIGSLRSRSVDAVRPGLGSRPDRSRRDIPLRRAPLAKASSQDDGQSWSVPRR
jgi:mycofactocin system glycosyltransferase